MAGRRPGDAWRSWWRCRHPATEHGLRGKERDIHPDTTVRSLGERMRKLIRPILIFGAGAIIAIGVKALLPEERVTLVSLSPDERYRVRMVEVPAFIDRNFELRLEDLKEGMISTIYTSPDEGRPIGSERIVWSRDSARFLLLGRRFSSGVLLPETGELAAYLMYDVTAGEAWCAADERQCRPLSVEAVRAVAWEVGL